MFAHAFLIILTITTIACHLVGVYCAVQAVLISRTPQAAIGWGFSLVIFPYLAIPLFLIFGESRFSGYTLSGKRLNAGLDDFLERTHRAMAPFRAAFPRKYLDAQLLTERLRGLPVTHGNDCHLLVDGRAAFDAIFAAIDKAEKYIIVQFFIVHDDGLGRELKKHLLAASQRGVKCWLLFDKIGSKKLTQAYLEELKAGGISVAAFRTNRQMGWNFQINFRNHRKLVVVDGNIAFFGGLNAGDEYLGLGPLGPWRDTHMSVAGPAVQGLQLSFIEDWHYSTHEILDLPIACHAVGEKKALPFASGPAETWTTTPAMFCEIIHDVRHRLWIASPYFVPDPALRTAIAHAALRGVDVRILLPQGIDHLLPWLSSFTYYPHMHDAEVRIWRYQPGFMHQKVLLADDDLAIVGSVNLDYRSFMLNFELSAVVQDEGFATEVENMLKADFARSVEEDLPAKFANRGFFFRLKCRLAALMSPEQ